jgi:hypothetical protein
MKETFPMKTAMCIKISFKLAIIALLAFVFHGAEAQGSMGRNTTGTIKRHVPGAHPSHPRGSNSGHKPAATPNRGAHRAN